jgi:hypothetical protein
MSKEGDDGIEMYATGNVNKVSPNSGTGPNSVASEEKQVYVHKEAGGGDPVAWCLISMQAVTILLWGLFVDFDDSAQAHTTMSKAD